MKLLANKCKTNESIMNKNNPEMFIYFKLELLLKYSKKEFSEET